MIRRSALAAAALALLAGAVAETDPFSPPVAGTYELPPIQTVSERKLVAPDGTRQPLLGLAPGQVAVVAFVYRSCSDAEGCPLSLAVLRSLDRELAARADLSKRVRLVTVSFDPAHDTPAKMGELAQMMAPQGDWTFLTASAPAELPPLLADFGQDVIAQNDGMLRHVLKVFLVDSDRRVRNIYSPGFLRADVLLADVETLVGP